MATRIELANLAKLAEQSERYEEMFYHVLNMIEAGTFENTYDLDSTSEFHTNNLPKLNLLTLEERNLLCVAFKNVVGARRLSWRPLKEIELKQRLANFEKKEQLCHEYRTHIEQEIVVFSNKILDIIRSLFKSICCKMKYHQKILGGGKNLNNNADNFSSNSGK